MRKMKTVKLGANVDEGETSSKLHGGPVINDSTVTGGFIYVEVFGEDEAVEIVEVKSDPAETDETSVKAPAMGKRKDSEPLVKEEEISLKKRKLLDCAIDRLIESSYPDNSKVVENTKKEKALDAAGTKKPLVPDAAAAMRQRVMSAGQEQKDTKVVEHAEKEDAKNVKSVKKDAKEVKNVVEKAKLEAPEMVFMLKELAEGRGAGGRGGAPDATGD